MLDAKSHETAEETARKAECTKEIDGAYATINKNQEEYDKQLLTLSAGFLAISLGFIKDVVPTPSAICRGLLYASFINLVICIFLVIASYQISNWGLFQAKAFWENQRDGDKKRLFPYRFAKTISVLNVISGVIFILGICLAMAFVITNLHQEAKVANSKPMQEGAHVRVPAPGEVVQKGANMKTPPPPPPNKSKE